MATRVRSHLCKEVGKDKTGRWLPVDVIDQLSVDAVPVVIPGFYAVSEWSGAEHERFTSKAILQTPLGRIIGESAPENVVIKRNDKGVLSSRMFAAAFLRVPIKEVGEYHVEFLIDGSPVHTMPL